MWASPETTWAARPERFAGAIARRIRTIFPQLGKVEIAETWGGAIGQTVHGMPQIGQLRRGLWVASGFGRQGTEHVGDGRAADRAQHSLGRRTLAAVFAVRTGVGGRRHRPGRRPVDRNLGTRKFRRRRCARPIPGRRARQGKRSRSASGRGQSAGRNAATGPAVRPASAVQPSTQ